MNEAEDEKQKQPKSTDRNVCSGFEGKSVECGKNPTTMHSSFRFLFQQSPCSFVYTLYTHFPQPLSIAVLCSTVLIVYMEFIFKCIGPTVLGPIFFIFFFVSAFQQHMRRTFKCKYNAIHTPTSLIDSHEIASIYIVKYTCASTSNNSSAQRQREKRFQK